MRRSAKAKSILKKQNEESFNINDLTRLKNHLGKKKTQFEKDIKDYEETESKDEDKIIEFENFKVEAEDIYDDIQHYIEVVKKLNEADEQKRREQQRELERKR